jgi:hypothetical protein
MEEHKFPVSESKGPRKMYETMEPREINYVGNKENCSMRSHAVSEFCKDTWKHLCKR